MSDVITDLAGDTGGMATHGALILCIMGFVECAKRLGMPSRYAMPAAVVCSLGFMLLAAGGTPAQSDVITAVLIGLSASGAFSGAKAIAKPQTPPDTAPEQAFESP